MQTYGHISNNGCARLYRVWTGRWYTWTTAAVRRKDSMGSYFYTYIYIIYSCIRIMVLLLFCAGCQPDDGAFERSQRAVRVGVCVFTCEYVFVYIYKHIDIYLTMSVFRFTGCEPHECTLERPQPMKNMHIYWHTSHNVCTPLHRASIARVNPNKLTRKSLPM